MSLRPEPIGTIPAETVRVATAAFTQRRPHEVIHHSDQGSQYTSLAFGNRCREAGVRPSMGSVGDAYDCEKVRAAWGA